MYQNHNNYQVRRPYNKQHQFQETGIHKEHVFGTDVSVSRERGSIAILGKPEFKGRDVELVKKVNGRVVYTTTLSFIESAEWQNYPYTHKSVSKAERLLPGLYETGYFAAGRSYLKVTVRPGCIYQMDWS